jgi:hypothetical protein
LRIIEKVKKVCRFASHCDNFHLTMTKLQQIFHSPKHGVTKTQFSPHFCLVIVSRELAYLSLLADWPGTFQHVRHPSVRGGIGRIGEVRIGTTSSCIDPKS